MATVKTPTYSTVQETAILDAIVANGNVANADLAAKLAARDDMKAADGSARTKRHIIAKISTMARDKSLGISYERQVAVNKNGQPVQKKLDLVKRIAEAAGVSAASLDGLDKAPKETVEAVLEMANRLAEYEAAA